MTTGTRVPTGSRSRAHPRVQERRAAVRRAVVRRRRRRLTIALVVFSIVGVGWLIVQSSLLDVDRVVVDGADQVSVQQVRKVAGVSPGRALLLVDRGRVARRVEALPWVRDARVSIGLPGRLIIRIDERVPVGWIRAGTRFAVVDAAGRVLERRSRPVDRLPELRLEDAVPASGETIPAARGALAIAASVPDGLRGRVVAVGGRPGRWVMTLDRVDEVLVGEARQLDAKWSALLAVLADLGDRPVHLIDVSVPSVPAVQETSSPPPTEAASARTSGSGGAGGTPTTVPASAHH